MADAQQDTYAYEEEQEKLAEMKALHQPMKLWYAEEKTEPLRKKCGEYPQFWQDLDRWVDVNGAPCYREVGRHRYDRFSCSFETC
jgi:hypothetical protein